MYSFDSQHAGLNDMLNFDDPVSPSLSTSELFYDQSRPTHVNPSIMWNNSCPNDMSANHGLTTSNTNSTFSQLFGQITPPSDSCVPEGKPESKRNDSGVNVDLNSPSQVISHSSFKSPKSSKSRTMSSGERPSKRAKASSQKVLDDAGEEQVTLDFERPSGDSKREKYREKNRVAAAKCRAKKKGHVDNLEDKYRTQSVLNTALKQSEKLLRDELSFWRTQALAHSYCTTCHDIQQYNKRKAQNIAAESMLGSAIAHGSPEMMNNSTGAPPPDPRACVIHPDRLQSPNPVLASEPQPKHKSFVSPGDMSAYQTKSDGTDTPVWNASSSSGRNLTVNDEQELTNFVNETTG